VEALPKQTTGSGANTNNHGRILSARAAPCPRSLRIAEDFVADCVDTNADAPVPMSIVEGQVIAVDEPPPDSMCRSTRRDP